MPSTFEEAKNLLFGGQFDEAREAFDALAGASTDNFWPLWWAFKCSQAMPTTPESKLYRLEYCRRLLGQYADLRGTGLAGRRDVETNLRKARITYDGLLEAAYRRARDIGGFDEAAEVIDEAIARAGPRDAVGSLGGHRRIVWMARRHAIATESELAKPERARDMAAIADHFDRAADASATPPDESLDERESASLDFYRHLHRSTALKWRAFDRLVHAQAEAAVFSEALDLFRKGREEAEAAVSLEPRVGKDAASQRDYLAFWEFLTESRVHLLTFARHRDPEVLKGARTAVSGAIEVARKVSDQKGEDSIFPNRFY
jgi:hypothetical protein